MAGALWKLSERLLLQAKISSYSVIDLWREDGGFLELLLHGKKPVSQRENWNGRCFVEVEWETSSAGQNQFLLSHWLAKRRQWCSETLLLHRKKPDSQRENWNDSGFVQLNKTNIRMARMVICRYSCSNNLNCKDDDDKRNFCTMRKRPYTWARNQSPTRLAESEALEMRHIKRLQRDCRPLIMLDQSLLS